MDLRGFVFGPGVWHSPMIVLGEQPVHFVLVGSINGVAQEDRQETPLSSDEGQANLVVRLTPESPPKMNQIAVKAKL